MDSIEGEINCMIAFASGKGGTGKTTVAVNCARIWPGNVTLLDCDVEEPNCHLFLHALMDDEEIIILPVPQVDESLCNECGECGRFCRYNAIAVAGGKPVIFPNLCHGCGGCGMVCPRGAIRETGRRIGVVDSSDAGHIRLVQGRLDVGIAMAPPLIRAVKKRVNYTGEVLIDAPPGTSCPVIAAVRDADFVVLVTEPTPFGLHDLRLAVEMMKELALPHGVVINRAGIGDGRVDAYCRSEGVTVLTEIPDDRRIAEAYSRGEMIVDTLPEYRWHFEELIDKIEGYAGRKE